MWCIAPKQDAAFVCQMESVLEVYKLNCPGNTGAFPYGS